MDKLNAKVQTTQDETKFEAQNVGLYGYDSTATKWRRLACDTEGKLNIEATLELDSSTLAKAATQTDGTQKARCMGIDGAGTQTQLLLETNGSLIVGGGSVKTGNTVGDGSGTPLFLKTNADGELSVNLGSSTTQTVNCLGNTVGDGSGTATHLKTASDGSVHVVVENSDNVLIKGIQDGTTTQKDAKTNSNGDLRSALIGNTAKDGTGTNYYVLVDSDGKLETSGGGGGGGTQFAGEAALVATGTGTAMIGRDSSNVARLVATDANGHIELVSSTGAGVALESAQTTGNASLSSIDGKITACNTGAVVVSSSALPTGGATSALQTAGNASLATIAGAVSGTEVQVDVRNRTDASPVALTFSAGNTIVLGSWAGGTTRTGTIDVGGCSSYVIMMNMLTATANAADFTGCDVSIEYSPDDGSTFMGTSSLSSGLEIIEPKALYQASGTSGGSIVGYGVYIQSTSTMASPLMGVARTNKIRIAVQNTSTNALTLDTFAIYKFN